MKQTFKFIFIIAVVILPFYIVNDTVMGKSIQDLEKELNELEEEQQDLKSEKRNLSGEKKSVESEMDENLEKQGSIQEQINDLDGKISTATSNIKEKESEIKETDEEIKALENNIKQLNEEVDDLKVQIKMRLAMLKDRLRSIQENGGFVKYINVIFGSDSFGDLISRSTTVSTIMDSDKSLMKNLERDQEDLKEKEQEISKQTEEVKEQKKELEKQKKALDDVKKDLDTQKANQAALKEKLAEEFEELEEYNLSIEEENKIIANSASALEKAKAIAQDEIKEKKIAEEAAKKAAEEAAKEAAQNPENGEVENTEKTDESGETEINKGNKIFIKPTTGRIASGFGPRSSPGGIGSTYHRGVDIATSTGTPVKAGASGVVSTTKTGCAVGEYGCGGGYGNYIIITHFINGKAYDTLYAHLSQVNVQRGQTVSVGQVIGGVGSTGSSTGPHLHFEVHPGGKNSYHNAVNPLGYMAY